MKEFRGKKLLITGGTGSFGNAVLKKVLDSEFDEVRVFSRDEKKQDDMRKRYSSSKVKFYLGDVRDYQSLLVASRGVDYIFHAAALKQVPSCEFYPLEATNTNIIGTDNVIEAAILNNVKKIICLSTDKAVYPINAMGISKAMMEKIAISKTRNILASPIICITRYGNVMGSRGSVIPLFYNQIKNNKPITITNPDMTRFMMNLDQAIDLVLFAFNNGNNGDIFVQKSPSATIDTLAKVLIDITNSKADYPIKSIGTRHGEKLYEVLCSKEELRRAEDLGDYFRIQTDSRDLNYDDYFVSGDNKIEEIEDYNSHNTDILNHEDLKQLILSSGIIERLEKSE